MVSRLSAAVQPSHAIGCARGITAENISVNRVELIGKIDGQPQVGQCAGRTSLVGLVVVTADVTNSSDASRDKTRKTWHRVIIEDQDLATFALHTIKDGDLVHVEGMLRTNKIRDVLFVEHIENEIVVSSERGRLTVYGSPDARHVRRGEV